MIKLWLKSNSKDIVKYCYQAESGNVGEIMYSKIHKATKIDNQLDDLPVFYYHALHSQLMQWREKNEFPEQYTIAWG